MIRDHTFARKRGRFDADEQPRADGLDPVFGDFENFDDADRGAPGPVKVFEITDELRAADAAKLAARETPAADWKIRSELDAGNLRRTKAQVQKRTEKIAGPKCADTETHHGPHRARAPPQRTTSRGSEDRRYGQQ